MGEVPLYRCFEAGLSRSLIPRRARPETAVERMCHIRQSKPDYGLEIQVKDIKPDSVVPFSLGSGMSSHD